MKKKKRNPNSIEIHAKDGDDETELWASTAIRPTIQAAVTLRQYGSSQFGDLDLTALVTALTVQTESANDGDLGRAEAMLAAQAHTLDSIFNHLAQRAAMNMGEYMGAVDKYLKLALRAQSQCRATWETLATIKNPPVVGYVRQANIAHGHQQVNNAPAGETSRTRENVNLQNKLLPSGWVYVLFVMVPFS